MIDLDTYLTQQVKMALEIALEMGAKEDVILTVLKVLRDFAHEDYKCSSDLGEIKNEREKIRLLDETVRSYAYLEL